MFFTSIQIFQRICALKIIIIIKQNIHLEVILPSCLFHVITHTCTDRKTHTHTDTPEEKFKAQPDAWI